MRTRTVWVLLTWGLAVAVGGCAHSPAAPAATAATPAAPAAAAAAGEGLPPYRIQPGDTLDIKFFYNPELNESVTVRPDGYISLQLIDDVRAVGLQPAELDALLTELYARELKKPVVTVIVKSFAGQRVYVGGEVNQQGLITMAAGMTPLQAVMQSGGFRATAQPSETLVIRKGADRRPVPIRVDLGAQLEGAAGASEFRLQPDDIVFVPKSPIAKVNQFVNQYIEQLFLFRGVSLGFGYQLNNNNNNN